MRSLPRLPLTPAPTARARRLVVAPLVRVALLTFLPLLASASLVMAEDEYERAPINYSKATPNNRISALQTRLDSGKQTLRYDDDLGYLPDVLDALGVPKESQMLVFSRTSLQLRRISPRTPRAIYFNDDVYIGFCQSGDVLEISAVDPQLGTVFYTLDQELVEKPKFERRVDNCLICHSSSRTEGVPGHLVRSLYVDRGGTPILSSGSRIVDHTTPLEQRWGGWYVTGTHGKQSHLGNLIISTRRVQEPVDNAAGQNVAKLDDYFRVDRYLTPHSDIVALMVLEHQTLVHNHLTKANFATRQALAYEKMMNKMLDEEPDNRLESTTRRIHSAGGRLSGCDVVRGRDEADRNGERNHRIRPRVRRGWASRLSRTIAQGSGYEDQDVQASTQLSHLFQRVRWTAKGGQGLCVGAASKRAQRRGHVRAILPFEPRGPAALFGRSLLKRKRTSRSKRDSSKLPSKRIDPGEASDVFFDHRTRRHRNHRPIDITISRGVRGPWRRDGGCGGSPGSQIAIRREA